MKKSANSLRIKKRDIVLNDKEDIKILNNQMVKALNSILNNQWGNLEQTEIDKNIIQSTKKQKILKLSIEFVKTIITAFLPFLLFYIFQLTTQSISAEWQSLAMLLLLCCRGNAFSTARRQSLNHAG